MEYLPTVLLPMESSVKETYTRDDYDALLLLISNCIRGDCYALKVNDEIVWNLYDPRLSIREYANEKIIRNHIGITIDNINDFLERLRYNKVDSTIVIYMFKTNSWTANIHYSAEHRIYTVEYFMTEGYSKMILTKEESDKLANI